MKVITIYCAALLMLCSTSSIAAVSAVITVQPDTTVAGDNIYLGDIATIEGSLDFIARAEKIIIGATPLPGDDRSIRRQQVETRLKQHDLNTKTIQLNCPRRFRVAADYIEISKEQIEDITRRFIFQRMPWAVEQVRIDNFISAAVLLPTGVVSHRCAPPGNDDFLGRISVDITFSVNGKEVKTVKVSAEINVIGPVAVANRTIERHRIVTPQDFTVEQRDITYLARATVMAPEDIIGKRAKGRIRPGMMLRNEMFESAPVVYRGDVVTIMIETDSFRISAPGEVLEDGCMGDIVQVSNLSSNNKIYAYVKAPKLVEARY